MKISRITLYTLLVIVLLFFLGPKVYYGPIETPEIELLKDVSLEDLDEVVDSKETKVSNIRFGNEAKIIWADSSKRRTRYSIVYLHGFSASHEEGNPVHLDFAKRYGFNLYLSRLANHGLEGEESMSDLTPNGLIETAKEAVAIGQLLGEEVIVMSTSTGGTLSIYLAGANPELIDALILFSPNIEIADPNAKLLTLPWGLQLGKMIVGDFRSFEDEDSLVNQYWTTRYRIEAIAALQKLLSQTMKEENFKEITQPYFLGYYYKNDEEQDHTVSVEAIKHFDQLTSTTDDKKLVVAFPDVGEHVLASYITSKDLESVEQAVFRFADEILKLKPVKADSTGVIDNK
ncbi:MAG: alpha/beta hydrolase [Bacteroidota bacterium]